MGGTISLADKKIVVQTSLAEGKRYFIIYQIKIPALRYIWTTQANYTVNSLTTLGAQKVVAYGRWPVVFG